jgi:sigma-B regulation protein RsbQ
LEICHELDLHDVIFVGHSVSAMIGVLAAVKEPARFHSLIAPSPRYIHDVDYVGGFRQEDIDGLLELLDSNYMTWASMLGPTHGQPGPTRGDPPPL